MLLFSPLVAGSFALGSLAVNEIALSALNTVRFWIATVIIETAALATKGISRPTLHAPWRYVLLAIFFTTYFVMMFEGLKTAPPVSAATVFTLTPVLTAGFGWLRLSQVATLRPPSSKVMAYTCLTPSWVIVWELALGGTPPPLLVLAGLLLMITALVLLLREE